MKTYKIVEKKVELLDKWFCDRCGKDADYLSYDNEGVFIYKSWGYYSKWDDEVHSVDLCQDCWKEFIEKFIGGWGKIGIS